jgi:hypothetical protein
MYQGQKDDRPKVARVSGPIDEALASIAKGSSNVLRGIELASAMPIGEAELSREIDYACSGIERCVERVPVRGAVCSLCEIEIPRRGKRRMFVAAYDTLNPEGAFDWCVPGHELYLKTTARARSAALRLPVQNRAMARAFIESAAWQRDSGSALFLGPTGIGKSRVLIAIGLRVLRLAETAEDSTAQKFAAGIRYIDAMEMARAIRERKIGTVDHLYRMACDATLLLLDEVGFEDGKLDPVLVRDLLRARYRMSLRKPGTATIMASGATLKDLNIDYGEASIRTVWERGALIDLHAACGMST